MSEIIVGYDGSDCSKAALEKGMRDGQGARRQGRDRLRLRARRLRWRRDPERTARRSRNWPRR